MKILVKVKPNAKKAAVTMNADGSYTVSVKAPAQEGKANAAVIEALAEHFLVPKSAVKLLKGSGSRFKTIEISK